jgi:Fe-S-cluster containining protein
VIDPATVYFTWPDRALSYQCAGCGACCKGLGIGIDATGGQLAALTARRPRLIPFLRRRGDAVTAFNPRDRCWFLAGDGLCRIEVEDGRAAKPASCRLFPFNRVFTLGALTIVDYNSVICPLRLGGDAPVAHADVLAEIESIADPAIVGSALPADGDGLAILTAERELSEILFASTGVPMAAAIDVDAVLDTILGAAPPRPTGATLAAARALIPSLRFNELWGPRQYAPRIAVRDALPAMTGAWLGFAALGAELAGRDLGMQELTTIWSEQAPVMYAAARWADVPSIKPGPLELPAVDPGGVIRALARAIVDNRAAKKTLGAIATPILARASAIDRVTAVKLAEPVLRAAFKC